MMPLEITKTGPLEISIRWDDEHLSVFTPKQLREACVCAGCVDEMTGKRILDPGSVPDDMTVKSAEHVGRYGVKFTFSDGHDAGIYTWSMLRRICPCGSCESSRAEEAAH